jgi:hypothetical protein
LPLRELNYPATDRPKRGGSGPPWHGTTNDRFPTTQLTSTPTARETLPQTTRRSRRTRRQTINRRALQHLEWLRVVRSDGYIRSFFLPPPGDPILFCTIVTGLRVYFEGVSYSGQGVSFAVEWVAALIWACTWAVIIEEMDVSNGPESGRNLAVIVAPRTASLCQRRTLLYLLGR